MREELSNILVLNYQRLQQSFEAPFEFAFLSKEEIDDLLTKKNENQITLNFCGISFNRAEQERLIIKSIHKKAEEHKKNECWETLLKNFGFQLNESWAFEGNLEKWEKLIKETILPRKKAIIFNPKISLKIDSFALPIQLNPSVIIYYRKQFTLLLRVHSKNIGKSLFGPLIFYEYFFRNHLKLKFREIALFYSLDGKYIEYYFSLPTIKFPKNLSYPITYLPIFEAMGLEKPEAQESVFSEFLTQNEYNYRFCKGPQKHQDNSSELMCKLSEFKSQIMNRLSKLNELGTWILEQLPEKFELSAWYKNISWTKLLSIESLKSNYLEAKKTGIFTAEGKLFKNAISLLLPNFPILNSSLIDIKKIFPVIEKSSAIINNFKKNICFNDFLSYIFYDPKLIQKIDNLESSIFSIEGRNLFKEKILNIKWKIYYDFESWENILTQLSLQIFQNEKLFLAEDLIRNPFMSEEKFHRECLSKLINPILTEFPDLNFAPEEKHNYYDLLKKKIVYISFNKTFECTWLNKLSKFSLMKGDVKNSLYCLLIRDLTIDLSDWFKLSPYSSLNIIGALLGSHTLKKLAGIVSTRESKKYSQLEWAQEGRSASLFYMYFYTEIFNIENIQMLQNNHLSPNYWVKNYREKHLKEWDFISSFLKEYCYYDVQNMVDGVNWLKENYRQNEKLLVPQSEILQAISWFKNLRAPQIGELINSYLQLKAVSKESQQLSS